MEFIVGAATDVGIKKETNQDSITIKVANYRGDKICFAVLCDGMGGLDKGELASATVIARFSEWFVNDFPLILEKGYSASNVKEAWEEILIEQNQILLEYGKNNYTNLGTTAVVVLMINEAYVIANVGDSRAYIMKDCIEQVTKDQSLVAREVELGRMTEEDAEKDSRRNVLLQCVGATDNISPDYFEGEIHKGEAILLCSDGFRHEVSKEEMYDALKPCDIENKQDMESKLKSLIEINKQRMEKDNITVGMIKVL